MAVDVAWSEPLFYARLPHPWLEWVFSVPGNCFGPPIWQVLGPLWIFVWFQYGQGDHGNTNTTSTILLFLAATSCTMGLLVVPWMYFLRGHVWIIPKILYSHASFALSPLVGTLLCFALDKYIHSNNSNNSSSEAAASLGYHLIVLYNVSCTVVLLLKHNVLRKRPCATSVYYKTCIPRKHYPIIPKVLAKGAPDMSFPSGDVMAATCLATIVWHLQYTHTAMAIVLVAALGRMYFLAHHALDTVVGMMVALLVQGFSAGGILLPRMGTAQWYHPLLALGGLTVASKFRKGDQK